MGFSPSWPWFQGCRAEAQPTAAPKPGRVFSFQWGENAWVLPAAWCLCGSETGGQAAVGTRDSWPIGALLSGWYGWVKIGKRVLHNFAHSRTCLHKPTQFRHMPTNASTTRHKRGTAVSDAQAVMQTGLTSLDILFVALLGRASGGFGRVAPRDWNQTTCARARASREEQRLSIDPKTIPKFFAKATASRRTPKGLLFMGAGSM